jgi:hypothetical protein
VNFGGATVYSITDGDAGDYQVFSFTQAATSAATTLTIFGSDSPAFIDLDDVSVVEAVSSGAPEPASWALMILGFGLAGGALRRRREGVLAA